MHDLETICYMAGIIDGEGSIQIEIQSKNHVRKVDYFSIRLLVINTDLNLMKWLELIYGGKISKRKLIPNRRQCYKWNICSFRAADILKECLPYMIVKKRQAEVLIEFMNSKPENTWNVTNQTQEYRRFLYDKLKLLNKNLI